MEQSSSRRVKSDIPTGRNPQTRVLRDPPLLSKTARGKEQKNKNKQKKRKRQPTSSAEEYFKLRNILREEVRQGKLWYKIDWEGIDPATGENYEPTWVRTLIPLAYERSN